MSNQKFELNKSHLGQVWTPDKIASEMISILSHYIDSNKDNLIIDAGSGPGTFERYVENILSSDGKLICFEIDKPMADQTDQECAKKKYNYEVLNVDYLTDYTFEGLADAIIMNPPYVRHENIDVSLKKKYIGTLSKKLDHRIDKRSNLFMLFLLKAILDLKIGGVGCVIVYHAVMNTQYGVRGMKILEKYSTIIQNKKISLPFENAIIDANIILFRKKKPSADINTSSKDNLDSHSKVRAFKLLRAVRGVGFLSRKKVIANQMDEYFKLAKDVFIKQSNYSNSIIEKVNCEKAYLFDRNEEIHQLLFTFLENRFETSKIFHKCKTGEIIFNYYIRNNPRFFYNPNKYLVSDNFYIVEPKHKITSNQAWFFLNSDQYISSFLENSRDQGNGLKKLQLFEFLNAKIPNWINIDENHLKMAETISQKLLLENTNLSVVREQSTKFLRRALDV